MSLANAPSLFFTEWLSRACRGKQQLPNHPAKMDLRYLAPTCQVVNVQAHQWD